MTQRKEIRLAERSARNLPSVLLDLGCGPGFTTLKLAPVFTKAIGLDPSPGMIEVAREMAWEISGGEKLEFVVGCAEDLSRFEDESIDFVIAGQSPSLEMTQEQ